MLLRAFSVGLLFVSVACARMDMTSSSLTSASSLTAPSPATSAMMLTIRVHARGTNAPIAGALVRHESAGYYTDASGESLLSVPSGAETTIDVSAAGYHAMQAAGVVNSDERWTFYLERE